MPGARSYTRACVLCCALLLASCAQRDPSIPFNNGLLPGIGLNLSWPILPGLNVPPAATEPLSTGPIIIDRPPDSRPEQQPEVAEVPRPESAPSPKPATPPGSAQAPEGSPPEEPAALKCQRYATALIECFLALRELERDHDPMYESHFKTCMSGQDFPSKPDVCKNHVSPRVAAAMISNGRYHGFPDFLQPEGNPTRTELAARCCVPKP